jgi:hypothetical protein
MRDLIRKRLAEYRAEALGSIAIAKNGTKLAYAGRGTLTSSMCYLAVNKDNETGLAEYMDRSIHFIRHVASSSWAEYSDELRDAGRELKQEIMEEMAHDPSGQLRGQLEPTLDKIINRKVEDFGLGYTEGKDMNATTNNTVNIINSEISNAVVQITQSGRDVISKETALKLQELVNSDHVKELSEPTRLEILDQVTDLIKELKGTPTDTGKVHRGLKRLAGFLGSVASSAMADTVAQIAVAYATAYGLIT